MRQQIRQLSTVLSAGRGHLYEQALTSSGAADLAELLVNFARKIKDDLKFQPMKVKKALQDIFKSKDGTMDDVTKQRMTITMETLQKLYDQLTSSSEV